MSLRVSYSAEVELRVIIKKIMWNIKAHHKCQDWFLIKYLDSKLLTNKVNFRVNNPQRIILIIEASKFQNLGGINNHDN